MARMLGGKAKQLSYNNHGCNIFFISNVGYHSDVTGDCVEFQSAQMGSDQSKKHNRGPQPSYFRRAMQLLFFFKSIEK